MLQSNSNLSLESETASQLNDGNSLASSNNANSNSMNGIANMSGDFNLYQLDSNDYSQTASSSGTNSVIAGTIDENAELNLITSSNHSSNLIHSSSANNLQLPNPAHIESANKSSTPQPTNSFSSSKSIHSFNLPTPPHEIEDSMSALQLKKNDDSNKGHNSSILNTTKFMKQSGDNISQKEISVSNSEMISIGCQTISTGDITVTNVYIE